jgi:hypothetical protein
MGAPLGSIVGHAGFAIHTPTPLSWIVAGEIGGSAALGSTASTSYGYLVRIPFKFFTEGILSRSLDYRSRRYLHLHFGGSAGPEFALGAQCNSGDCNYIAPGVYTGLGLRSGISLSQASRSSLGLFARWDVDLAQCAGTRCGAVLHTFTWNLGWSLF